MRSIWLCLYCCLLPTFVLADPLDRIPVQAGFVLNIQQPRILFEKVIQSPAMQAGLKLASVQDVLDQPQVRTAFEILKHLEKRLGHSWPQLLDKLAGKGLIVATGKVTEKSQKVLLAMEGTDPALLEKLETLILDLVREEVELRGQPYEPQKREYAGYQAIEWSPELLTARKGNLLLIANKKEVLKHVIDMEESIEKSTSYQQAQAALPKNALATIWVDFDPVRETEEAKVAYMQPRNDVVQTVLFAGLLDVLSRSPYLAFGLYEEKDGLHLAMRQPTGHQNRAKDTILHVPAHPAKDGTLPLLFPKDTFYTHSFYMDVGATYSRRKVVLPENVAKDYEKGVQEISRFTIGTTMDQLLTAVGPHHRVVFTKPAKLDYKKQPEQPFPSVAHIVDLRTDSIRKPLEATYRAIGFFLSSQVSLQLFEDKWHDIKIIGYRFPEDGKYIEDPTLTRFNFMPCFAMTKNRLITASNPDLCKEILSLVEKETDQHFSPANMQLKLIAAGGKEVVAGTPGPTISQSVLHLGQNLTKAREELQRIYNVMDQSGSMTFETTHADQEFRFDLHWNWKK